MKIKINLSSANNLANTEGTIKQNGFNSYVLSPVGAVSTFEERFEAEYNSRINDVFSNIAAINAEADDIRNSIIALSNNLTTNYLSEATFNDTATAISMASRIAESTATFATNAQVGGWYGLNIVNDVNGVEYISGFDMGAIASPEGNDSYFRINADKFIVGGDLGDGAFTTMTGVNGEPLPAFAIEQDGNGNPQIYFNGKVNIASIPENLNKYIGEFEDIDALNAYLAANPDVVVNAGDTYLNTSLDAVYMWTGTAWISTGAESKFVSIIFKRSADQPETPSGGDFDNPIPDGWSDGIPEVDPTKDAQDPVWWTSVWFSNKVDYVENPIVWPAPTIAADSETADYMYNSSLTTPTTPTYTGDLTTVSAADAANGWYNTAVADSVWAALRVKSQGTWAPWQVYKIKGEDGADGATGATGATGSRGSAILTGTATTASGFSSAFNTTFGNVIRGDQYISSTSSGTLIWTYSGSVWQNNTALQVHGDAVINGTLSANKLATNYLQSSSIYINDTNPNQSTPIGSSNAYFYTSSKWAALVGSNAASSGAGIGGKGKWGVHAVSEVSDGRGVVAWANASNGIGLWGEGNLYGVYGKGIFGLYTPNATYSAGGYSPFTGSHIVFGDTPEFSIGDIVDTDYALLTTVDQSYVEIVPTITSKSRKVYGVLSKFYGVGVAEFLSTDPYFTDSVKSADGSVTYKIKPEYQDYYDNYLSRSELGTIGINALGEGGINVCEANGDIENGDYICSSNVKGKGMKQDDDLLHNYTVAKALEDVIWANEVTGENGCFEQDGVKCKMIACTYHCG